MWICTKRAVWDREGVPTSGVAFMRGSLCEEKGNKGPLLTIEPLHGAG